MIKKCFVYMIINLIDGKKYIGKTAKDGGIEARFKKHKENALRGSEECPKLYNSMRKHGVDNFIIQQLEEHDNEDLAYQREGVLVEEYNTRVNGLNTVPGGRGCVSGELNPMFGKGHLIAGEKNGMFGRTGELNPFYGKTHSEEFVKAIKEQNRELPDEVVIDIKKMLTEKIKYNDIRKKYEGQYKLSDVSLSRIKDSQRYADVGTEYQLSRPKHMSEAVAIAILKLWEEYPDKLKKGDRINLTAFYNDKVKDQFDVPMKKLTGLIYNRTWTHLERNYVLPPKHKTPQKRSKA